MTRWWLLCRRREWKGGVTQPTSCNDSLVVVYAGFVGGKGERPRVAVFSHRRCVDHPVNRVSEKKNTRQIGKNLLFPGLDASVV